MGCCSGNASARPNLRPRPSCRHRGNRMRRREFIAFVGAAASCPRLAMAQSAAKTYRVGLLSSTAPLGENSPLGAALIRVLGERGYENGKNLAFERRGAGGQLDRLPQLVAELAASKVDVIV